MTATASLDAAALDLLFRDARSHNGWVDAPVDDAVLREAVDLAKMGPTAANSSPLRIVFVKSAEAKAKLKPCLAPGNVDKTMAAPVTAILAFDPLFYDRLPKLFPHADARAWFAGQPHAEGVARMNATLQAAYLLIALRSLGLDTGPMTGFDAAVCDAAFFADGSARAFMLLNIGRGDPAKLFARSPRLDFEEMATIA
ncbi:MAG: malonic semialdehyde reductase [Hyphomicrobiales bacterium]|nr:malonic semialdehyde reductase [Hyphomicrobiales bacterium]